MSDHTTATVATPDASLQWSSHLAMGLAAMDDTHEEFVHLLATVESASDDEVLACWRTLVDHTDEHFAREDRWMVDTQFAASNCHTTQHQYVLQVLREGVRLGAEGDLRPLRQMAKELVTWFPAHAQAMDAALAEHLRRVGYDPATGVISKPEALPPEVIHGCGGSCGDDHAGAADEQTTYKAEAHAAA